MKRLLVILSVILVISLVLVSCSENPQSGNTPSEDKTQEGYFPKAFNNRTFRIKGTDSARTVTTSGENEYYFITTADNTLNFDLHQNKVEDKNGKGVSEAVTKSYNVSVTVTVEGTSCTAKAENGSTYTFTATTAGEETIYTVAINDVTNTSYNGTYTIETVTPPVDYWPLGIELYQDVSKEAGTCPARVMITPAGLYFVFLSTLGTDDLNESAWTRCPKSYFFYLTSVVEKTDDGFTAGDKTYNKLTFVRNAENGGYTLTLDNGTTMTWNLVKAEYDYSFFFNEGMLQRFMVTTPES